MTRTIFNLSCCIAIVFSSLTVCPAHWKPADGHKMHWPQTPDPAGWAVNLNHIAIADDFKCSHTGPITDIHFWIAWRDNILDEVLWWDVAIYSDGENGPGQELWSLAEASVTIQEENAAAQGWVELSSEPDPENPGDYLYDNTVKSAEANNSTWRGLINISGIQNPFVQVKDRVYWIVIRAHLTRYDSPDYRPEAGWKTSDKVWRRLAHWTRWPLSSSNQWHPLPYNMAFVINGPDITERLDWGDTPQDRCGGDIDPTDPCDVTRCCNYPTTRYCNGARHVIKPGIFLGNPFIDMIQIDAEKNGQPSDGAIGDDEKGIDDEEGIILPKSLVAGTTEIAEVWVGLSNEDSVGYLHAWIDFNGDGDWDDEYPTPDGTEPISEKIFDGEAVKFGQNFLKFRVPNIPITTDPYKTYGRFRLTTTKVNLSYTGKAADGEVEDYLIYINPQPQPRLDFGDVPQDNQCNYPVTLECNGARHVVYRGIHLGRYIDAELDGQPSHDAMKDDLSPASNLDDEDGVYFSGPLVPGEVVEVKVIASTEGFLNAWFDFNADRDWDDHWGSTVGSEYVFIDEPMKPGVNYLKFRVPTASSHVVPDRFTFARFRFTTYRLRDADALTPANARPYAGLARNGEVEDYLLTIEPPQPAWDFGDAPDPCVIHTGTRPFRYPTKRFENGARHIIRNNVYLGNPYTDNIQIDAEPDGQPTQAADGDDIHGADDEQGVEFLTPLMPGLGAKIKVWASVDGYLNAWVDFNGDGDWDDYGEQIFASEKLSMGENYLKFKVPPYPHAVAKNTRTYARFRFSSVNAELKYAGPARDGEVEDYTVKIEEPPVTADLGDAPDSSNSFGTDMMAYPSDCMLPVIVPAHFPTVYRQGSPPHGPIHWHPRRVAWLGGRVSLEEEADTGFDQDPTNNLIPVSNTQGRADLDKADDAIRLPLDLPQCRRTDFDYVVTVVQPVRRLYVNVWFDWNRDGDWDDNLPCRPFPCDDLACTRRPVAREWAVRNQVLTGLTPGIHSITTPRFRCWHDCVLDHVTASPIWMRISLSEEPWDPSLYAAETGWGGAGPKEGYMFGETEDYYFRPSLKCEKHADLNCDRIINLEDLQILLEQWLRKDEQ